MNDFVMQKKRITARLLAVLLLIGCFFAPAEPAFAAKERPETTLSGVQTTYDQPKYTGTIEDTITVSPAKGRKLLLQHYDGSEWVTEKTYRLGNRTKETITITYPSCWKKHAASTYRLYLPATKDAKQATQHVDVTNKYLAQNVKAAVVMDVETGKIAYEYNASRQLRVGSITKLMTCILAIESGRTRFPIVSQGAGNAWDYTTEGGYRNTYKGETYTLTGALYAMMLPSCNEMAESVGLTLGAGSTNAAKRQDFARKMTARARKLGATRTYYTNACGLDAGSLSSQCSTAKDVAKISRFILTDSSMKALRTVMKTANGKTVAATNGTKHFMRTTNLFQLSSSSFRDSTSRGIKTGFTYGAGYCFAGAFQRGGRTYITVVLGAGGPNTRFTASAKLADFGSYVSAHPSLLGA